MVSTKNTNFGFSNVVSYIKRRAQQTPEHCISVHTTAADGRADLRVWAVNFVLEVSKRRAPIAVNRCSASPAIWPNFGQSCARPKVSLQEDTSLIISY